MRPRREHQPPIAVITAAEPSQFDQLRARQRRYLLMMGIRVVCLIAAAICYSVQVMWAVPILIVGMVALPWMAVIIANDRAPLKPSRFRRAVRPPAGDRVLEGPRTDRIIDQRVIDP